MSDVQWMFVCLWGAIGRVTLGTRRHEARVRRQKRLTLQCYHLADQKQLLSGLEKQVDSSYFSSISME